MRIDEIIDMIAERPSDTAKVNTAKVNTAKDKTAADKADPLKAKSLGGGQFKGIGTDFGTTPPGRYNQRISRKNYKYS